MSRRAQSGLGAMIIGMMLFWLLAPQGSMTAQANPTYRVFVPMIATSSTSSTAAFWSTTELQAFELINQQRRANGCAAVQLNHELGVAAKQHSQDMAANNYVGHTGKDGSSFVQRAIAAFYTSQPSGEVVAAGRATAAETVNDWMNSPAHRAIITDCANQDMGIALATATGTTYTYYWTAVFGRH